ncbi:structural protein [Synechococcus phage S-N03]|uniref:Structural protein n=1 Tax=Synechococcus phage S-N03 TaxID=2718943 RepID=A0A6G8R677_9CAUD|nr:structural protein [Synechococcus phage S-N03]QIN96881.1 structural protein [Synechococcus phage S-N03]
MPIQKNLNVAPYYDDFDPKKNFYKVLYKAGYPIQARELTTQQSITSDQIEQIASRILTEGDNVVPGEITYRTPYAYIRLSSFTQGVSVQDFVGYTLTGVTSGVIARVDFAAEATDTDDATLYINYISSGTSGQSKTFLEGEVLESSNEDGISATVGVNTISKPVTNSPIGTGALYGVTEGAYFVDGMAVRNTAQTIIISKYDPRPTCEVGFLVTEDIVTSSEDSSLLDNSQGSSNFAAPGADRLKITLTLVSREQGAVDPNFIRLSTITQGNLISSPSETVKWDWLYEILARRTYDESGDYIVTEFPVTTMEYWNGEGSERGLYDPDPTTGLYPLVPGTPVDPNAEGPQGLTYNEADSKYVLNMSPGKAYVRGYEVEYKNPIFLYGQKARTSSFRADALTRITEGYNLNITNLYGTPDFGNITGEGTSLAFDEVIIYRNFIDGFVGEAEDANGRPLNLGNAPWRTFHIIADGPIGASPTGYTEIYKEGNTCVVNASVDLVRGSTIGDATILASTVIEAIPAGVMRPRYLTPEGTVDLGDGFYGYNSTYNMGVMTSVYFTELDVVGTTNPTVPWTVGELVRGEDSGAVGTVESGSSLTNLLVSNVAGTFLPGEEIIQTQSATVTKVSRILRPGEISGFVFTDKGTSGTTVDLSSQTAVEITTLGSTKTLTVADGDIVVSSSDISITETGRAKLTNFPLPSLEQNLGISYQLTTVPGGVKGYAISRGSNLTNTLQLAKSFYSALADTNDFSADISIQDASDAEIIAVANDSSFTAAAGSNILSCDVFSGDPSRQLIAGDLITFVDDNGVTINRIVQYATKPAGYGSNNERARIYLTTTVPNAVNSKTVQRIRTRTKGNPTEILLYDLPQQVVKTLETNPEATEISYEVKKEFILNVAAGASTITLTTNKNNEYFVATEDQTTIVIAENISNPTDPQNLEGRVLVPSDIDVSQDEGRKVIYTIPNTLSSSVKVKVIAPIFVSNAISKRKILRSNQTLTVPAADAEKAIISLGKADVFQLNGITQAGKDITDNYTFDNGQRDNVYDIARVTLKTGRPAATGEVLISFDYFEHSGEGDFFSVDSYTSDESFNYANIPTHTPTFVRDKKGVYVKNKDQQKIQLRDTIDFRPVVSSSSVIASITDGVDAQSSTNFRDSSNGGDAFAPRIPIADTNFRCDMQYYMPRYDSVFLESNGTMSIIAGAPGYDPEPVPALASAIRLYDIYLPAYTFTLEEIYITKFNYKRYRMKDIAAIDRRVERLEETITLSLLEQSAVNTDVRDSVTGLDRFANGIVVDSFRDHSGGDVGIDQYRCSIDDKNDQLRSPFFKDQAELEEKSFTDDTRTIANYVVNNGIATLPFTNADFVNQPQATRWVNLQPYSVFTYEGELALNPPIDTFSDQNRQPDLVIEDNSVWDATTALAEAMNTGGFGTVWSEWEQNGDTLTSTQTTTTVNSSTGSVQNTSYGDRITDVQLAETMRSIAVGFRGVNLKPDTRYYAFFDKIDVTDWISIDELQTGFDDGLPRYQGEPNRNPRGFGFPLMSDGFGNIQGIFIIPNGRAPEAETQYNGRMNDLVYRTSGTSRSFNTGTKTLRLTDNPDNPNDLDLVGGICEADFTSSGVILDVQETIVSTRIPEFSTSTSVTDTSEVVLPQPVVNNITNVTEINNTTNVTNVTEVTNNFVSAPQPRPVPDDPVAQSFAVEIENEAIEGLFVTELDLFFRTKDDVEGVEVYLVTTDGQVPTQTIIPHSLVQKNSHTTIRTICTSLDGDTTRLATGTQVMGATSGAVGTLKSDTTFASASNNSTQNVTNHVYTLIMDQYSGEFIAGEELVPQVTPRLGDKFYVAADEIDVTRVDIKTLGENYTTATVTFSEPELPGGIAASAELLIGDGKVYQLRLTNPGKGYTKTPTVSITGDGSGATATARSKKGQKAVDMGVTTSEDATLATTFKFHAPVYLQANTWYAWVAKAPTSLNYTIWTAKMGEDLVGTETRVVKQPTSGSLFMSQNGGLWTDDQTQDATYNLRRASFETANPGVVTLQNAPIDDKLILLDPIETNIDGSDATSNVFGDNPQVVRVYHFKHGLVPGDLVKLSGVANNPGGIPNEELNTLHTVLDADFDTFTIKTTTAATSSVKAGGPNVYSSYTRPYEVINVYTGAMNFAVTSLTAFNRSIQAAGVTGYNATNAYRKNDFTPISLAKSYYYNTAQQVADQINEADNNTKLGGERSLETSVILSTGSEFMSPVLDIVRTNATIIHNLIDNPVATDDIYGTRTRTITFDGDISATTLTAGDQLEFTQSGETTNLNIKELSTDANKITISGQFARNLTTSSTFSDATLSTLGVTRVSDGTTGTYFPETSPNGTTFSKFISRLYVFENPCDGIDLKLAAIFYDTASIKVYYRPRNIGFDGELNETNWIPFNGTGLPDQVEKIQARSSENVNPTVIPDGDWQQLNFTVQDIPAFDALAIKIVMTADNPAHAPLIDDIQMICSE